jgi:hypothetical protein
MQFGKAIGAGVTGALAMTVLMAIVRWAGMPVNLEMMLGTMVGREPGPATWVVGLAIHLMMGALFAIAYAAAFEYATHRAGAAVGAGIGLAHAAFSGIMMAAIPAIHPMVPEAMPSPGMFMVNMGLAGVTLFLVEHVMFGAIVGGIYRSVSMAHRRPAHA